MKEYLGTLTETKAFKHKVLQCCIKECYAENLARIEVSVAPIWQEFLDLALVMFDGDPDCEVCESRAPRTHVERQIGQALGNL